MKKQYKPQVKYVDFHKGEWVNIGMLEGYTGNVFNSWEGAEKCLREHIERRNHKDGYPPLKVDESRIMVREVSDWVEY